MGRQSRFHARDDEAALSGCSGGRRGSYKGLFGDSLLNSRSTRVDIPTPSAASPTDTAWIVSCPPAPTAGE
jgi:hypothetical protein